MSSQRKHAPLEGRYWLTVAFVLLALVPDLILSTATPMLQQSLAHLLYAPPATIALADTFSNAGWEFGAVLASFLALRFASYKMYLLYEGVFVLGSLVAFVGPTAPFYVAGRIIQGTTTTTADGTGKYLWIAGLIGFGAGITVSPGLFMAGLAVVPNLIGRAFDVVELMRLAGAFAFVPVFIYFSQIYGTKPQSLILGAHVIYHVLLQQRRSLIVTI
jgi:hypothetical protein